MASRVNLCGSLLFTLCLVQTTVGQTDTISVIHVNDTHSCLAPIGERGPDLIGTRGGLARAATLIKSMTSTLPHPLLLHAGDLSVGDFFYNRYFGVPEYEILASLGCRAMTVGNHEFDLGPDALRRSLDAAFSGTIAFPLLSANTRFDDPRVGGLTKYIHPFIIEQAGATKVGIFGLTTPATMLWSSPAPAVVDTPFSYAAAMVDSLTSRGCAIIICLSHLGYQLDRLLASMVPGINAIVGGHDHDVLSSAVPVVNPGHDTTWIVQAGAFYLNVGMLQLARTGTSVHLLQYHVMPVDVTTPNDPRVDGIVSSLISSIETTYGRVYTQKIGESAGFFEEVADSLAENSSRITPVGSLVADAFRSLTGTQIALEPGGCTAQPVYGGPLVAADLFRVVGYGFNADNGLGYHLIRMNIPGRGVLAGLEFGLSDIESNDEYFLQTSGLRYSYDARRPAGSRVVSATVGGIPVCPDSVYTVSTNAFVKSFLDLLKIPYSDFHEYVGDTTEFMALSRFVRINSPISPSTNCRTAPTGGVPGNPGIHGRSGYGRNCPGPGLSLQCSSFHPRMLDHEERTAAILRR